VVADRNVDAVYFMLGAGQIHRLAVRKKPRNTQTITKPRASLEIGLSFCFAAFPNKHPPPFARGPGASAPTAGQGRLVLVFAGACQGTAWAGLCPEREFPCRIPGVASGLGVLAKSINFWSTSKIKIN